MDKPRDQELELGGELWNTLPSNAVEWSPSNFCDHFARIILAREAGFRDEWIDEVKRYGNELARLRSALEKSHETLLTASGIIKILRRNNTSTAIDAVLIEIDEALQGGSDHAKE